MSQESPIVQEDSKKNEDAPSLSRLFARAFRIYQKVSSRSATPLEIKSALEILEQCDTMCRNVGLYLNRKEFLELSELGAMDVRLLSVLFLKGYLRQQLPYDPETRRALLLQSQQDFITFLSILDSYSLFEKDSPLGKAYEKVKQKDFNGISRDRTSLIERIRFEKKITAEINELLKRNMAKEDDELDLSFSDERDLLNLNISQLKQFASMTFSELSSIERELPLVEYASKMKCEGKDPVEESIKDREREQKSNGDENRLKGAIVMRPDGTIAPLTPGTTIPESLRSSSSATPSFVPSSAYKSTPVGRTQFSITSQPTTSPVGAPFGSSLAVSDVYSQASYASTISSASPSSVVATFDPMAAAKSRQQMRDAVFNPTPTWTISLEEEMEREAKRQMERLAREKKMEEEEKARPKPREDSDEYNELERKGKIEWDEWKDDHPAGSGNRG
ncbi:putative TAP42-like family [Monocercomonoides exilis]|uniref:putative TAP42-like family n=1 Tax=Monocercomonoides exilis TaxID=2049356 RepID=UPI00355A1B06|nr:putative TAP42-like family [Monocercomonoides exilis]|eukprot:MONOS_12481.1-p1 / transcript=MONOS_12481.1 / gene=MONOS_12481 / organism=Monocercomonoides_exilis_PA203 / gene_product=unspecified product / transcript_product=unspecified product / location=Mono_scaffold00694:12926-14369(-) / protein_length=447 / sequence_SO=supercontig / SO=protein_coding / is_pseudo=false